MTEGWVREVLARQEHSFPLGQGARLGRVLVTGARGSVGMAMRPFLEARADDVLYTDVDQMDVTDLDTVLATVEEHAPDRIIHLAGAKHAPLGEEDPYSVLRTNAVGTHHVLLAAERVGASVTLASTCKAADPETAYGASKLVAERMVLNAGGAVARFYNVVESSGNVFEIWRSIPEDEPIPVVRSAERIFISMREAVMLTLLAAVGVPGRFAVAGVQRISMYEAARIVHPDRELVPVPRRRGDRLVEPYQGISEHRASTGDPRLAYITSPHDTAGLTVHELA